MKIYIERDNVDEYINNYINKLNQQDISQEELEARLNNHLNDNLIVKYDKRWQDNQFNYLIDLILFNKEGYWIFIDLMKMPHIEFEHYTQKSRRSYEKGNVPITMAEKELPEENFKLYKLLKTNDFKTMNVDLNFNIPK